VGSIALWFLITSSETVADGCRSGFVKRQYKKTTRLVVIDRSFRMKTYIQRNYKAKTTLSYRCGFAGLLCNGSASATSITKTSKRLTSTATGDSTRSDDQTMSLFTQNESTNRPSH